MNTQLSRNFTLHEMTYSLVGERKKILNVPSPKEVARLELLCREVLQPLRDAWGEPIIVNSAYRGCVLNRAVGGTMLSDHIFGSAADIRTLSNTPQQNAKLFYLACRMINSGQIKGVKQLIDECNYRWIHLSRQDGRSQKTNEVLHLG